VYEVANEADHSREQHGDELLKEHGRPALVRLWSATLSNSWLLTDMRQHAYSHTPVAKGRARFSASQVLGVRDANSDAVSKQTDRAWRMGPIRIIQ